MAEGNCAQDRQMETGTLSLSTDITGSILNSTCYKIGNIVTLSAVVSTTNHPVAYTSYIDIPVGFRPRALTTCMGEVFYYDGSTPNQWLPAVMWVNPNGHVEIRQSSDVHMSYAGFAVTFSI